MKKERQGLARLKVTVTPKSSRREVKPAGDRLLVRVTVPPAEGQANEMCLELVADWLDLPKSRLVLLGGARQREKLIGVAGLSEAELARRLRAGSS